MRTRGWAGGFGTSRGSLGAEDLGPIWGVWWVWLEERAGMLLTLSWSADVRDSGPSVAPTGPLPTRRMTRRHTRVTGSS